MSVKVLRWWLSPIGKPRGVSLGQRLEGEIEAQCVNCSLWAIYVSFDVRALEFLLVSIAEPVAQTPDDAVDYVRCMRLRWAMRAYDQSVYSFFGLVCPFSAKGTEVGVTVLKNRRAFVKGSDTITKNCTAPVDKDFLA